MPSKIPEAKVDAIAAGVAGGQSLAAAARAIGIPESTARRWSADPTFSTRVAKLRNEIISQSIGIKSRLLVKADGVLSKLLDSPDPEVQLKAVRLVNDGFLAVHAAHDMATRLEALEARAAAPPGRHGRQWG